MNILTMLWNNLRGRARTLRFPARPAMNSGFRGLVHFDPARCSGCAVCRFRCTARAITFTAGKAEFTWSYDPGHCTFCGRCVDGCKEHALSQDEECPPVYSDLGSLRTSYTLPRKTPPPHGTAAQAVPAVHSSQEKAAS